MRALTCLFLLGIAAATGCSDATESGPGGSGEGGGTDPDKPGTAKPGESPPGAKAADPCSSHAWPMAGGCRGAELRTKALAPVAPKARFEVPIPEGRFVFGSVVDAQGGLYLVLGAEDQDFAAPERSVVRIDPDTKKLTTLLSLAPSRDHTALALAADGTLLVLHEGVLFGIDPQAKAKKWELTVAAGEAAGDIRVGADGSLLVSTDAHLASYGADRSVRWNKAATASGLVMDAKGRFFTVASGPLGSNFVAYAPDGSSLFTTDINPASGWYGTSSDGELLYGAKSVRDVMTTTSYGAMEGGTGVVRWERPMDSGTPSPNDPLSFAEQFVGAAVIAPGDVLVRTTKRIVHVRDGKSGWAVELPQAPMGGTSQVAQFFVDRTGAAILQRFEGLMRIEKDGARGFDLAANVTSVLPARDGALWVTEIDGERRLHLVYVADD
jgi:hypothetical protein